MKAKILIVEDESLFALELEVRLEKLGYSVCGIADNSQEAIRLTEIHNPDLILMDIKIKGDTDGIETAEIIRKEKEIAVIFLTAYSDKETIDRAKSTLPYGYILKPFDVRELYSAIEIAVHKLQIERNLLEAKQRLELSESIAMIGHYEFDMASGSMTVSKGLANILHIEDPGAASSLDAFLKMVYPDDRQIVQEILHTVSGSPEKVNFRIVLPEESVRFLEQKSIYQEATFDKPPRVMAAVQDVTENRITEISLQLQSSLGKELAHAETMPEALQKVINGIASGMLWDIGEFWKWKDGYLELEFQTSHPILKDQFKATDAYRFQVPEGLPGIILENGGPIWFDQLDSLGSRFHWRDIANKIGIKRAFGFPISSNRKPYGVFLFFSRYFYSSFDQLTSTFRNLKRHIDLFIERQNAEELLRSSEQRFRTIWNSEPQCVKILDEVGTVFDINPAGLSIIEAESQQEVRGKSVFSLVKEPYRKPLATLYHLAQNGQPGQMEYEIIGLKGSHKWLDTSVVPYYDDLDQHMRILSVTRDITERKQAEQKYKSILETAIDGFWVTGSGGRLLEVNDAYCRMSGYSRDALLQMSVTELEVVENEDETRKHIEKVITQGSDRFETKHRRKDGTIYDVEVSVQYSSIQGTFVSFLQNITERKRMEEKLKNSERTYRLLFENNLAGVFTSTVDGVMISCNDSFAEILGYKSAKELEGQDVHRLYFDQETRSQLIVSLRRDGFLGSYELCLKKASGDAVWVLVATRLIEGEIIQGTIVNITERRRAEEELRESEEAFRKLFDESADPVLLLDETGFTNCNQSAVSILGYSSKEEFLIKQPWEVSPERQPDGLLSSEKAQMMINLSISKGFHRFEWIHTKADGREFPVEVMLTPIFFKGKRIIYTVWRDIAERKRAEKEMNLLLTLTRTITEAGDFDSALTSTLRMVSESASWDYGEAWIPSSDRKYLRYSSSWYGKGQSLETFHKASSAFTFTSGVGLPGRVWVSKEPLWIPDVTVDPNFLRIALAKDAGLHAAVGIPILAGSEVVAVMAFFFNRLRQEDEKMVTLVSAVAAQLGTLFQRKHAEQALRESEERNRSLLDAIPDMIFRLDPQGRFIDFKVENTTDLYVMPDQLMGKSYEEVLPEDLREKLRTTIASARSTRKLQTTEYNLSLRGGIHTFEVRILVTNDDEIVAVVRNITDRKKSEKMVRQLSSAIEQTADYVMITDIQGIIQYVNPSFLSITGFTEEEVVGMRPRILKSDLHDRQFYKDLWKTILAGKTYRGLLVNRKKNGDLFYEEKTISPIFDESGSITQFVSTGKDITESKKAETLLKASEIKYRSLVDSSPDMIFLVKDGEITTMNATFRSLLGYTDDNVRDRQLENIFVIDPNFHSIVNLLSSEQNTPVFVEGKCQTKSGKWLDVEIGFVASKLEGASIIHGTARDITEFKVLQEKTNQMQRLASLGQMSATIAHEIRNPLASMILNLRYLRKNLNFSPKYEEVYDDVITGATRIEGIVSGILQFSKTPVMEIQRQDICNIVSDSLSLISPELKKAGIDTKTLFSSKSIYVNCDSRQMTQLFTNLFTNARQAMTKGGQLTVRIDDEADRVHVIITDTGKGIPKDQLANIFEPFFTTRPDGTGLGLAIVSKILLYHNANITVESEPGKGSQFSITFHKKKDR